MDDITYDKMLLNVKKFLTQDKPILPNHVNIKKQLYNTKCKYINNNNAYSRQYVNYGIYTTEKKLFEFIMNNTNKILILEKYNKKSIFNLCTNISQFKAIITQPVMYENLVLFKNLNDYKMLDKYKLINVCRFTNKLDVKELQQAINMNATKINIFYNANIVPTNIKHISIEDLYHLHEDCVIYLISENTIFKDFVYKKVDNAISYSSILKN